MMPGDDSPSFETGQIIAKSLTEFLEGFIEARLGAFLTNSFWEKGLQPGGPPPPPHGFPRLEEIKLNLKLDGKGSVALLGVGGGELSGGCSVELTFKRDHSKQQ
jgi:hypothetical protein